MRKPKTVPLGSGYLVDILYFSIIILKVQNHYVKYNCACWGVFSNIPIYCTKPTMLKQIIGKYKFHSQKIICY